MNAKYGDIYANNSRNCKAFWNAKVQICKTGESAMDFDNFTVAWMPLLGPIQWNLVSTGIQP